MTREETRRTQALLNRVGGLLVTDGLVGRNTRRAIADARAMAGLPPSDRADKALVEWLEARPSPSPDIPTEGVTFIAREEVGGRDYYENQTAKPHWPGGASGITIGVGYDLRYSANIFEADWISRLDARAADALRPHLGRRGSTAKAASLDWIRIPWTTAWQVFVERSLPLQVNLTTGAFNTFDDLPGLCRSALVSLVFNRGTAMRDSAGSGTRREMRAIRDLLKAGDLDAVPDQILSMRRLWPDAKGLRDRREREAALWRRGLEAVRPEPAGAG